MITAEILDVGLFASMPRYGDLAIHAAIDLRRAFSRSELERAARAAVAAFPVLDRRYKPRFFRNRWVRVPEPIGDVVHLVPEPADLEAETRAWVRRPIESTRERPFRIVGLPRGEGSRLLLSVMHLAVDGAGMAAVGHVVGAALYGVPPAIPVDSRRDLPSVLDRLRWYHAPTLARDTAEALIQPLRTLSAAVRERPYPTARSREASYRHLAISAGDLAAIRARCRGGDASVNDVLVAALARVAARRSSGGPVSVLYTMDLRRYAASPRLVATNASSILTVVVPRGDIGDLAATAGAVARRTARHRRRLAGPAFLLVPIALGFGSPHAVARGIARLLLHPLAVEMPLRRGLLVTNVGRLDEGLAPFGGDLEDVRIIGPNIDGVTVPAVVAYGFRGGLTMELFAPPGLAAEALDELEGELREALEMPA